MTDSPNGVDDGLDALLSAYALKDESRTGWDLRGVEAPESVAGHTWGVALLCLAFADRAGVDPDRALRLAVVHDLGEADVGDVPVATDAVESMGASEKAARERDAVERYDAALGGDLLDLWEEYERRETDAAAFVKDMDLVDMVLQALCYERERRYGDDVAADERGDGRLDEFFDTAADGVRTDVGRRLLDAVRDRYEAVKRDRSGVDRGADGDSGEVAGDGDADRAADPDAEDTRE